MPRPLQPQIDALTDRMDKVDATRAETNRMVAEMYGALMQPQLGQGDKSLVERMANITVNIEAADRAAASLAKWAKRLTVIGAVILAIAGVLLKLEIGKE